MRLPDATLERSEAALNKVQAALLPLEEVETISTLAGYSLMTETEGASFGMGMINLTLGINGSRRRRS